jgi:hypothetical protein
MEGGKAVRNIRSEGMGTVVCTVVIVSAIFFGAWSIRSKNRVDVTGYAEKIVRSDYITWDCSFSAQGASLKEIFDKLKSDSEAVRSYLLANGVEEKEIFFSHVSLETMYKKDKDGRDTNEVEGYLLRQGVEVRSGAIAKIEKISREAGELVGKGIRLESERPQYLYMKLTEFKKEMFANAAENARSTAEGMAKELGKKIKKTCSAETASFYAVSMPAGEETECDMDDTSSFEKKVIATVTATFELD